MTDTLTKSLALAALSRGWLYVFLFVLFAALLFVAIRLIEEFIRRVGPTVLALERRAWRAFLSLGPVRRFNERHPRFDAFLARRFDPDRFAGLPLTIILAALAVVAALVGGIVEDVAGAEAFVDADVRIDNMLAALRTERLMRAFLWVTLLGKWQIVAAILAVTTVLLFIWNRRYMILPLWMTLAGSQLVTYAGKVAAGRARPEVMTYVETTPSFPSGHATLATAFYGFLCYILWRSVRGAHVRANVAAAGVLLALAIGFSRNYLGVHFVSDVVAGFLIGLLWLVAGITVSHSLERHRPRRPVGNARPVRAATIALVLLTAAYFVHYVAAHAPELTRAAGLEAKELVIGDPVSIFAEHGLPRYSETVTAVAARPLNVLLIAPNDLVLGRALETAGWRRAHRTTLRTLYRLLDAAGGDDDDAHDDDDDEDVTPAAAPFYSGRYVDFTFSDADSLDRSPDAPPQSLMLRLWKTRFRTADARAVYVGVAGEAEPAWRFAYSGVPLLDSARDTLVADLFSKGLISGPRLVPFVDPVTAAAPPRSFATDGRLAVIELK